MSELNLTLNGVTYVVDAGRPLSGGVAGSKFGEFLQQIVAVLAPTFTVVTVANTANVALVSPLNVLQTTANGTIATANLNLPTSPTDGEVCKITTTGAITTVSGTAANSTIVVPAVTTLAAGGVVNLGFNAANNTWYRV